MYNTFKLTQNVTFLCPTNNITIIGYDMIYASLERILGQRLPHYPRIAQRLRMLLTVN